MDWYSWMLILIQCLYAWVSFLVRSLSECVIVQRLGQFLTGFALYKFSLLLLPLLLLLSSKNGTAQTRFPDSCRCVPSSFFDSCLRSFTCPPFLQDDYDHGHQCQVFYLCPFHLLVTAVARKRPRSFCQNCRWQVTPKHTYTLDPTKSEWAEYAAVQA